VLVVVVLLGAAALLALGRPPDRLSVATSPSWSSSPSAVFDASGVLRAERHGGRVCFALVTARGSAPTYRLVFPAGYAASPDLHLLDPGGHDVIGPGFAVGVAFSTHPVDPPSGCGRNGEVRGVVRIEGLTG
jgi:hypothetical protein